MWRAVFVGWSSGRQPRLTAGHVTGVLLLSIVLTAVVPPAFGWGLNRRRVTHTEQGAQWVAESLRPRVAALVARAGDVDVACGPGRLPNPGPTGRWVSRAVQAPGIFVDGTPADAWGRCFLVNLDGLATRSPVWVISAGPNGRIETPPDATQAYGDDVAVRLEW